MARTGSPGGDGNETPLSDVLPSPVIEAGLGRPPSPLPPSVSLGLPLEFAPVASSLGGGSGSPGSLSQTQSSRREGADIPPPSAGPRASGLFLQGL